MFQDFSAIQWNMEQGEYEACIRLQSLDCRPYTRYHEDYSKVFNKTFDIPYTFMSYKLQDYEYVIEPKSGIYMRNGWQKSGQEADCKENYRVFYVGDFANRVFFRYVDQGAFDYGYQGLYDHPTSSAYDISERHNNGEYVGFARIRNGTASDAVHSVIHDVAKKSKKIDVQKIVQKLKLYQR